MRRNPNKQKSAFYIAVICQEICVGYEPRDHLIMLAEHKGCPAGSSHPRAWEMTPVPVYVSTLIYLIHTHTKKKKVQKTPTTSWDKWLVKSWQRLGTVRSATLFAIILHILRASSFASQTPQHSYSFQLAFKFISTYKENHWYLWKLWLL